MKSISYLIFLTTLLILFWQSPVVGFDDEIRSAALLTRQTLTQTSKDEATWNSPFRDLYQTNRTTKDGASELLIYLDVYRGGSGTVNLFKGDDLGIIDAEMLKTGDSSAVRAPEHLSGIDYSIDHLLGAGKGFRYCCVTYVFTNQGKERKGYANFALRQLIDMTFQTSCVDFFVADTRNYMSEGLFGKMGFTKSENGSFDLGNGRVLSRPSFYSGHGGSYYLSRPAWEKSQGCNCSSPPI